VSEPPQTEGGLLGSAKQMLQTLGHLIESRMELFLLELKEERVRLVAVLLLVLAGAICALMTLVLATFTLVVVFWNEYRIPVLVVLTAAYAAGAIGAFASLRRRLRRWQAFSASLEQIKKDRACLGTKN
jgi:uncharacterized membrane protein YqjE